jgi:hypothetical protein
MIVPTKMDARKGENLAAFLSYALGDGQRKAAALGYAPVSEGVRKAGQAAVARINGTTAAAAPDPAPNPAVAAATDTPPAAEAAPDPALASTGAGSALTAALAGSLLALGGLGVGLGRRRRAPRV